MICWHHPSVSSPSLTIILLVSCQIDVAALKVSMKTVFCRRLVSPSLLLSACMSPSAWVPSSASHSGRFCEAAEGVAGQQVGGADDSTRSLALVVHHGRPAPLRHPSSSTSSASPIKRRGSLQGHAGSVAVSSSMGLIELGNVSGIAGKVLVMAVEGNVVVLPYGRVHRVDA